MAITAWWNQVIIVVVRTNFNLILINTENYAGFLFCGIKFWDIMHQIQYTQYLQHLYLGFQAQYLNILDWHLRRTKFITIQLHHMIIFQVWHLLIINIIQTSI